MYEYEEIEITNREEYEAIYEMIELLRDELQISEAEYMAIAKRDIYDTTALEGNQLTRMEVTKLLEDDVTIRGKSTRDHLQVKNMQNVLPLLKKLVMDKTIDIDIDTICMLHHIVTKGELPDEECGRFRKDYVTILTTTYIPSPPEDIMENMNELLHNYKRHNAYELQSPFERICEFHRNFERIHPFADGNGRTGRLVMNIELLRNGYCYLSIPKEERNLYFDAIEKNTLCEYLAQKELTALENMKIKREEHKDDERFSESGSYNEVISSGGLSNIQKRGVHRHRR